MKTPKKIIEIEENGDPYGSGYVGHESTDNGHSWYYMGNIGPQPLEWWETYCKKWGIILRRAQ